MSIYRGPGGATETTDQATITAVQTAAAQAASSASAASNSATTAANSATGAANSAANAANSATSASVSAAQAETSVSAASGYANDASLEAEDAALSAIESASYAAQSSGHATDASGFMNNAYTYMGRAEEAAGWALEYAEDAAQIYDAFDDRYLGSKDSDPATDNDGNPLISGALYFNTTIPEMRVWDANLSDWTNFAAGASVSSFNERTGVVTLLSADVTGALGYTPADVANVGVTIQPYNANTVVDSSYVHTDNNYTTTEKNKLAGIAAGAEVNVNADWNASSGDAQILNKPSLATVATTGAYSDLSGKPSLSTVATTGAYSDLTGKPTNVSAFANDAGYLTTETDPVFTASAAAGITSTNISNWNTAYGWGNHATAGYINSSSTIDGGTY